MSKKSLITIGIVLAAALIAPFVVAIFTSGPDLVFGGFLMNQYDGNSYLAKMRIGWRGEWRFHLPYTADPSEGAYLFLFYILLGHIARITSIELPWMYHIARILSSVFLIWALGRFIRSVLKEYHPAVLSSAIVLCVFGSGLGWAVAFFGGFTSDFWVSEAYPFLSMFINPHFPLGVGLLLVFLTTLVDDSINLNSALLFILGVITAIIQPFSIVAAGLIAAITIIWEWFETKKLKFISAVSFLFGGGIFLIYQYIAILRDPQLSIWNQQNICLTPPLWDIVTAFSPSLILAAIAIMIMVKNRKSSQNKLLITWLIAVLILVYIPSTLQRRFLIGYYIPCAILASIGLFELFGDRKRAYKKVLLLLVVSSVITNLFLLIGSVSSALRQEPWFYLSRDEYAAFQWMNSVEKSPRIILAAEQTSMYIPAYTDWRVIYGHLFETVHGEERKKDILNIFNGAWSESKINEYIQNNRIQYVFWGQREQKNLAYNPFQDMNIVYQNATVKIYETGVSR